MHSPEFIKKMKQRLLEARKKLQDDLAGLKPHEELGSDVDASAQEVEDDELSQDLIVRLNSDLEKINKALAKIEAGTYGVDDQGRKISEKRLEALPWADKAL
jgi:RNA polymerase-binding transcription factor DksA